MMYKCLAITDKYIYSVSIYTDLDYLYYIIFDVYWNSLAVYLHWINESKVLLKLYLHKYIQLLKLCINIKNI
jgi:hypothetical protein